LNAAGICVCRIFRQQLKSLENCAQRDEFFCVISKHRPNRNRPEGISLWAKFKSAVCKWYESADDSWGYLHGVIKFLILFSFLIFTVGVMGFMAWLDIPEYVFYVTIVPFFGVGFSYLTIKLGVEPSDFGGGGG
jgi:hypothetical protein